MTQGRNGCCHQWVKKYRVQYSMDCSNNSNSWHPIGDHTVNDTVSILPDLRQCQAWFYALCCIFVTLP